MVWKPYKGSEPQAAIQMLLQNWPRKISSVRGTADNVIQQHISQHPCLTALGTRVSQIHQAQLHLKFFLVINLLNGTCLQWESYLWAHQAADQSRKITSLWKAHLSMRHPYKELSIQKKTWTPSKPSNVVMAKVLASFWCTHLSRIFPF